jgi:hypothetical protein
MNRIVLNTSRLARSRLRRWIIRGSDAAAAPTARNKGVRNWSPNIELILVFGI